MYCEARSMPSRALVRPFSFLLAAALFGATATVAADRSDGPHLKPGPTYHGMCDASASVAIDAERFVVANDEDNTLRIYHRDRPAEPLGEFDMTSHLDTEAKEPESDIEGACWLDGRIYWITSHGRNKKDKLRESRHRLFCTEVNGKGDEATVVGVGKVYRDLLAAMIADGRYARYKLEAASKLAPKKEGALNIEGLAATPNGQLLVAMRNPIPGGRALIAPIENPKEIIDEGADAKLGNPIELSLADGGRPLGIRSMEYDAGRKCYWIVGGHYDSGGRSVLFRWSGENLQQPAVVKSVDFGKLGLNPESLFLYPGKSGAAGTIQILSDDGTKELDGKECKKADEASRRSFRTAFLVE
ncbi:MAG: DUF3616 domain-containing protein [Pirellulales bacterium]